MSNFTLLPLEPEDIPHCITIYFAAFQNPHSLGCWPRTAGIRTWWEAMFLSELSSDPFSHWRKAVATADGRMAGFVKWQEPRPGVEPDETLPEWPVEADRGLCDETFVDSGRKHLGLMGGRGHWYLEVVATDPAYQGQGAGSLMLRYGVEKADEAGVEAYLEASPDAVALYEKFGFREAARTDTFIENERVKGTWYRSLFMLRPAKTI